MSTDPTEPQSARQRTRSREMSLKRDRPPIAVPGYEPERFLGMGAYGEVWVHREGNTGRRVAIKFYAHRGGLDWSLLSREVEKLAFLFADRYVVQLLGVGWDAEPPYYVMEYLEHGSLADRLHQGPMPVDEAVATFRDVAVGLVHAHGKGVLHCDLKPANVLLDGDAKPRLADFGQSRLSHEQTPALGTLFYMAPEQADLEAAPDARWDVYALGALLYCMLTGRPPHQTDDAVEQFEQTPKLDDRLAGYRRLIEQSAAPSRHRRVRGMDAPLAAIVDRCLTADPNRRYPNVQAVLEALDDREARRARRPALVLGAVGPALMVLVAAWFAWQGFSTAVSESDAALTRSALRSNRFAAQYVARTVANELDRRRGAVMHMAVLRSMRAALAEAAADPEFSALLNTLSDPAADEATLEPLRERFQDDPRRKRLEEAFASAIPQRMQAPEHVASWFLCDARGVSMVRLPEPKPERITVGKNFAWRSFFHGGPQDMEATWRPSADEHVRRPHLSAVFRSQANRRWIVAISAPVYADTAEAEFLGVVALTVAVGQFVELEGRNEQFAVLVDARPGDNEGVILEHPLYDALQEKHGKLPDRFTKYRLDRAALPEKLPGEAIRYVDPLATDPEGGDYRRDWLAYVEELDVHGEPTGWLVIVQEAYDTAIGSTLQRLRLGLVRYGLMALAMLVLVIGGLWTLVMGMHRRSNTQAVSGDQ